MFGLTVDRPLVYIDLEVDPLADLGQQTQIVDMTLVGLRGGSVHVWLSWLRNSVLTWANANAEQAANRYARALKLTITVVRAA
jgi:hypothetical protein